MKESSGEQNKNSEFGELVTCIELLPNGTRCDLQAEVHDRFELISTDEPITMIKTICVRGHVLNCPEEMYDTPKD